VIQIDGFLWFVGALLICGAHAIHLRGWRRERREHLAWWRRYDADSRRRHDEFMRATDRNDVDEWNLDGSRERGQA
jgi:hypothetical protein